MNMYLAREMASIDELDAEIEEYMEKNGKLDDGGSDWFEVLEQIGTLN